MLLSPLNLASMLLRDASESSALRSRPGYEASEQLVRYGAYSRMWMATGVAIGLCFLLQLLLDSFGATSQWTGAVLIAVCVAPACTFLLLLAAGLGREEFKAKRRDPGYLRRISYTGYAAAVLSAAVLSLLLPI